MTIFLRDLFFAPKIIVTAPEVYLNVVLSDIENEIGKVLSGKTNEQQAIVKVLALCKKAGGITRNDSAGKRIFAAANKAFLSGKSKLAAILISLFHKKVTLSKLAVLRDNFAYAKKLLEGTPYNHGYIDFNGNLALRKDIQKERENGSLFSPLTMLGLNCMTMNNILVNLTVGAKEYTPQLAEDPNKKGKTNEDIFSKKELFQEGVYKYPVIKDFPAKSAGELPNLLKIYGDFFSAQTYSVPSGQPVHSVFIYRDSNGEYRIMDTLAPGGVFNDNGKLDSFAYKHGKEIKFTVNLVDTEKAKSVIMAKKRGFLFNLNKSIYRAKREFTNWKQQ